MSTHPRSLLHVLCRLMRLHSGHVTLPGAEFQPAKLSPQSDLRRRAASRWALPQISSSLFVKFDLSHYSKTVNLLTKLRPVLKVFDVRSWIRESEVPWAPRGWGRIWRGGGRERSLVWVDISTDYSDRRTDSPNAVFPALLKINY